MTELIELLKNTAGVDDYLLTQTVRTSYELFFVHKKLETVRATDTTDTAVTVYVAHDGKLGDSSFAVHESMRRDEISALAEKAVQRAKLVFNEPWELPTGGKAETEIPSNFGDYTPQELAEKIAEAVFAADNLEGGSINATEIFLYRDTIRVVNSRGIDKTQVKYHAMVEAIPTWNEGESVELYENYTFTQFDPAAVTEEIGRKMREVRDRQYAEKPKTPLSCNVVLNAQEIAQLVSMLTSDLSCATRYAHANRYQKGDDLQPGDQCDKLTVTRCGAIDGSVVSASFDGDGFDLCERTVIQDGKAVESFGSVRYASYLGEEPTGTLRCSRVAFGTLTQEEVKREPYLECVSLSGLQLDLFNDYIGGEIRLAYYYDGETTRPVTGISMSAKLSDVLATLRLSAQTGHDGFYGGNDYCGAYVGPAKLLMKNVSVL